MVEYEQGERYFNGDYSDSFTLEFKEMPNTDFYDEFDNYYHKSGALKYPPKFMELVDHLKKLNRI